MQPSPAKPSNLSRLTDVQLVHHLNAALSARERDQTPDQPSRACLLLRVLPTRATWTHSLVVLAVTARDAITATRLAVCFASGSRLAAWARISENHLRAVMADIAILRFLSEMERRADVRGSKRYEPDPELHRG